MADVYIGSRRIPYSGYYSAIELFPNAEGFQVWGMNDGKDFASFLVPNHWEAKDGYAFEAATYKICSDGSLFGGWHGGDFIFHNGLCYRITEEGKGRRCVTTQWGPGTEAEYVEIDIEVLGRME